MEQTTRRVGLLILSTLAIAACSRKPVQTAPPTTVAAAPDDDSARRDSIARAEAARRDSLEREARLRAERDRRIAEIRNVLMAPVYFNYDRAEITPETRQLLDAKVPLLSANADLRLRLSGHADERGSDEYNIALGQRRAAAVWHYLIGHGIAQARLEIVSFGEERPVCQIPEESCWRQNRRVEFDITAGADRITER